MIKFIANYLVAFETKRKTYELKRNSFANGLK